MDMLKTVAITAVGVALGVYLAGFIPRPAPKA
jgi:hypothetical protein